MHEQVTHTLLSFLNAVISDPDTFAAGLQSTDSNFAKLSDGQKLFFFATMLGLFKHFELMYVQHTQGVMDRDLGRIGANIFECIITSRERRRGGVCERSPSFPGFAIFWSHRPRRA